MITNRQNIFMSAAMLLLAGCSNDEQTTATTDGRVALQVTSGIQSRAAGNAWEAGDAIGIYMLNGETVAAANRKYTIGTAGTSGTFTADATNTIYFPIDGSQVDFYAYYPHQAEFNGNGEAVLDVSDQTRQSSFDLMTARLASTAEAPLDKSHPAVALNFSHRMTRLELNITAGTGIGEKALEGLKVEITNQRTEGLFDPVFDAHGVNLEPVKSVTMLTAADGLTASAILVPCGDASHYNPIKSGRELVFTLAATGEVFRWAIPDKKAFNEGDRNIYNITINRTGLDVTATIEEWNKVENGKFDAE